MENAPSQGVGSAGTSTWKTIVFFSSLWMSLMHTVICPLLPKVSGLSRSVTGSSVITWSMRAPSQPCRNCQTSMGRGWQEIQDERRKNREREKRVPGERTSSSKRS